MSEKMLESWINSYATIQISQRNTWMTKKNLQLTQKFKCNKIEKFNKQMKSLSYTKITKYKHCKIILDHCNKCLFHLKKHMEQNTVTYIEQNTLTYNS
jgi:hypothetical protein